MIVFSTHDVVNLTALITNYTVLNLNKHPDFYYTLRIFYSGKLLMFNTLFEEGYAPSSR